MTLPSSLSELDSEADEEQELSRITVLVGTHARSMSACPAA